MTLYDYKSVPVEDGKDGVTSAARLQALREQGYEITDESNGSWNLRREKSPSVASAPKTAAKRRTKAPAGGRKASAKQAPAKTATAAEAPAE